MCLGGSKSFKIVLREASANKLNYTIVNQEKGEENGTVRSAIQLWEMPTV